MLGKKQHWRLPSATFLALVFHLLLGEWAISEPEIKLNVATGRFSLAVMPTVASIPSIKKVSEQQAKPLPNLARAEGDILDQPSNTEQDVRDEPTPLDPVSQPEAVLSEPAVASAPEEGAMQKPERQQWVNRPPRYPRDALMWGIEGQVNLALEIGASGDVLKVVVDQSSGFLSLDDAARLAAHQWRFDQAEQERRKLIQWVRFRLDDQSTDVVTGTL